MKKFNSIFVKAVFAIVLLTTGTIVVNTNGINVTNEAQAATYEEVFIYLTSRGYQVITLGPGYYKYTWLAHTVKDGIHYWSTVYTDNGGAITGQTDVPM